MCSILLPGNITIHPSFYGVGVECDNLCPVWLKQHIFPHTGNDIYETWSFRLTGKTSSHLELKDRVDPGDDPCKVPYQLQPCIGHQHLVLLVLQMKKRGETE